MNFISNHTVPYSWYCFIAAERERMKRPIQGKRVCDKRGEREGREEREERERKE